MAIDGGAFASGARFLYTGYMQRPVAVFDIDGTLFRSSLLIELVEKLVEEGAFPKSARGLYARAEEKWLDREGDYAAYTDALIETFKKHLKGVPYEVVADAAGEIIETKKARVYRYTRDLVRELKKKGYYLLAISHSPKLIVDGFAYEHGFDKAYGMLYETGASGSFTGQVIDRDLIMNKAAVLKRAIEKEGLTLKGSVGVGDTESDIGMLELVERPVAFNPNKKLLTVAKRSGWNIVVERKDAVHEL